MLGKDFQIFASMGHIRDLPEHSFGVDIKNDFKPNYVESKSRAKIIKELSTAAKKSDAIYLAPDPDREGEAIAWHLFEMLKDKTKAGFHRVTFHEITKSAISKAFDHAGELNMNLVNSQQARRILDRLVGYQISPLLWSQLEKGVSAGRVQSVALRLVVEREREIQAFIPEEYWNFIIKLSPEQNGQEQVFESRLARINGEKAVVNNEADAAKILTAIKSGSYQVSSVNFTPKKRYASPPFITSTMQQAASSTIGFSANRTMQIAQQLYEGMDLGAGGVTGLITYMRTDSVNIAQEAQASCRAYIASALGNEYIPDKPNFYKSKSGAQEAHEAIRPTDVNLTPDKARAFLDDAQFKLYSLIWRRFVASQMAPAQQAQTTVEIDTVGNDKVRYMFRTTATVTTFQGFLKVYRVVEKDEDLVTPEILKNLKEGDACFLRDAQNEQKFTEPPPRFSEASLIRELESNGIGRPSTYASIVNTIQNRQYVLKESGRLHPSELGYKVNDYLVKTLPELFQVGFTADMETRLDEIEEGKLTYEGMLNDFYKDFSVWLDVAKKVGAPSEDKTGILLRLLEQVKVWAKPEKRGRRTYDDKKFFVSVQEKFNKDKIITGKQWQALLQLAVNYQDQLPELKQVAQTAGFADELKEAWSKAVEQQKKQEESAASSDDIARYADVFDAFASVKWAEPETRRGRTYDDKKFLDSIRQQVESGKKLSDKQLAVVARFAVKYKDQLKDFDRIIAGLGVQAEEQEAVAADPEVTKILEEMSKITQWAEPTKKGRRVYDDKEFYESIKRQAGEGKRLSPKQVFALKKLAGKYAKGQKQEE
jgi:DNA topoisomerase-1